MVLVLFVGAQILMGFFLSQTAEQKQRQIGKQSGNTSYTLFLVNNATE